MTETVRWNHFVPRFYLHQWSDDRRTIYSYRLLVDHENISEWSRIPVRSVGAISDLYTEIVDGSEVDEFERWVKRQFEDPAVPAFRRLSQGEELRPQDWTCLARFFAAQDVRTPASLVASLRRWEEQIPALLESSMKKAVEDLQSGRAKLEEREDDAGKEDLRRAFRVTVDRDAAAPPGMVQLRAEVTPGRSMWLASMKHLLTGVADHLTSHEWSIAEPHPGWEWITCDHPAMKLNYSSPTDYTFEGGWGSKGTDLMMPLSPNHLLFTQVGHRHGQRVRFGLDKTVEIQRLFCEQAHREIYARRPVRRVPWFRPRRIDPEMARHEAEEWARWHERQAQVEIEQDEQ